MTRPLRIFLCHASQDKPAVWRLHRFLKQRGAQPWLDQEDLLPGQHWEVEIPKVLFASDVILVCLSKNSINKEGFVQKEISFALDKALEKPEGTIFIIPVKLEECEIPRRLTRYQWVDLSRTDGRRRLLLGLNMRVSELGDEVTPVIMEDTRQRTPHPQSSMPEIQKPEEQISSVAVKDEVKEESKKEIPPQISPLPLGEKQEAASMPDRKLMPKKPFTKLLDPSSLSPKGTSYSQGERQDVKKSVPNNNIRWLGVGGIIFIGFLIVLFGGNYLAQNFFAAPTDSPISTSQLPSNTPTKFVTPASLQTNTPIHPTISPTPGIGSAMIGEDGMTLLYVPAGTFLMGSTNAEAFPFDDEKPQHSVNLDAFWIDQTEVTNSMYAQCVDAGMCDPPSSASHFNNSSYKNHPVVYVDWNKANTYCLWAGRRLPTEAEWEKAARGTDARIYPWGNDEPTDALLNYNHNINDTTDVGNYLKGASVYGSLDMAGNVWEWVNDWYDANYYRSSNSSDNPLGPESGKYKVLRGGSWNGWIDVRSADRLKTAQSLAVYYAGFRCASSP